MINNNMTELVAKKAEQLKAAADTPVTTGAGMLTLGIAAAFLGGLVLGLVISPRKKIVYNVCGSCEDYHDDYDDEDDDNNNILRF